MTLANTLTTAILLLGTALTQTACNSETTPAVTSPAEESPSVAANASIGGLPDAAQLAERLHGTWYLAEQHGGFRAGPPPAYTPTETTQRLGFNADGTFTLAERSADEMRETMSRAYAVDSVYVDPSDSAYHKLVVRFTPSDLTETFSTMWLARDGSVLITDKEAPAYDGIANHYRRVE